MNEDIWVFHIIPKLTLFDTFNLELTCNFFRNILYKNKNKRKNKYLLEHIIDIKNDKVINTILKNIDNNFKFIYVNYCENLYIEEFDNKLYEKNGKIIELNLLSGIKIYGNLGDFTFSLWDEFLEFLEKNNEVNKICIYSKCKKDAIETKYFVLCSEHLQKKWKDSIFLRYKLIKRYGDYHRAFIQKELNDKDIDSYNTFCYILNILKEYEYKKIYPIFVFLWKSNQEWGNDEYFGLFQVNELQYPNY